LLYYVQAFLGQYIHDRRSKLARLGPVTHPHPPLNILHIVLGVSVISIAFCQVGILIIDAIFNHLNFLSGLHWDAMVGDHHPARSYRKLGTPYVESLDTCTSFEQQSFESCRFILPSLKVLFLAYFGGYALLPRQFRQEREAAAGSHRPVASDDHGQSTPLLAEDREGAPS